MSADKCANCGRVLGRLEEACVWKDYPVCKPCYGVLARNVQPNHGIRHMRRGAVVIAALLAVIVTLVILRRDRAVSQREPETTSVVPPDRSVISIQPQVNTSPVSSAQPVTTTPPWGGPQAPVLPPPPRYVEGNFLREQARLRASINAEFPMIAPEKLVGQKFIIAANTAYADRLDQRFLSIGDYPDYPIYRDVVGKTCTLVQMQLDGRDRKAFIRIDGTGKQYPVRLASDPAVPDGLILASEIEPARNRWKGKALWYRRDYLPREEKRTENMAIKPWSKVTVIDVQPSDTTDDPIRFLLQTEDGRRGSFDVMLSGTTTSQGMRLFGYWAFESNFLEADPRQLCPHSTETWQQIENKVVAIGMNKEQVLLSWGDPKDIKTTTTAEARGSSGFIAMTNMFILSMAL